MTTQMDYTPGGEPSELIRISAHGDVLRIVGELDFDTASHLFASAVLAGEPGAPIRLDMSGVTFMDSSAVGALLQARQEREFVIINPSERVQRIMQITSLADRFGMA